MPVFQKNTLFWALVLLIGVLFQLYFPIASDEAYFISWGSSPAFGYYDHPPLPGWISYAITSLGGMLHITKIGLLHRLFSVGLGGASLLLIAHRAKQISGQPSGPVLIALALVPGYLVLFNLYLNDTLLLFTVLLFLLASEWAYRANRLVWLAILASGLSFAAVLLTKYNGAVIYIGMVFGLLSWPAGRRFLFGRMVLISLVALGPFLLHLWWNYNNCSINLAFNFGFRKSEASGFGPLWLLFSLIIMAGPLGFLALWAAAKNRRGPHLGFFTRAFLGSAGVMLVVSIMLGDFGANWGAPLGIMAALSLVEMAGAKPLRLAANVGAGLSALLLLPPLALIAALQLNLVAPKDLVPPAQARFATLLLDMDSKELPRALRSLATDRVLATTEYGVGAGFQAAGFGEVVVLSQSVFGRNQDLAVDFRALNGRNMLLMSPQNSRARALATSVFDSFQIVTVTTSRQSYDVVLGQGFQYEKYRENYIYPVITRLYDKNPFPYAHCYMDKYR